MALRMISLDDIREAQARIWGAIYDSPCAYSERFSRLTGARVCLKLDNLQRTGSFKERGALNKILTISSEERQRGLIAASAGNHAQAVAYHASRHGLRAVIWMPETTPLIKVTATREYGAEVKLHGATYDEAYRSAIEHAQETGLTWVHPFDDDAVIAGQGTLALDILRQCPQVETVLVPVGGGGLIGGMACALKELAPRTRVIGVQSARLPSMQAAVAAGRVVELEPAATLADGIAVRSAGERTLALVRRYVDDIVTVDEEEIANAILLLLEHEKTVAEGAGAVALAALLHRRPAAAGRSAVVVVSGGNIDVNVLSRIIERGLVKDGRLVRLRIHLPDHPGSLHRLTAVIARHRANIVQTSHDHAHFGVSLGDAVIDVKLETRGPDHIDEICSALRAAGYLHERVM